MVAKTFKNRHRFRHPEAKKRNSEAPLDWALLKETENLYKTETDRLYYHAEAAVSKVQELQLDLDEQTNKTRAKTTELKLVREKEADGQVVEQIEDHDAIDTTSATGPQKEIGCDTILCWRFFARPQPDALRTFPR